ncbi:uncharacterized protein LOC125546905 [Triticum urartu]|uniref:uncharacterized protein LOC125546905 n=1 Tax=Triticum urartu TaxID=4572 RepID=UPI002043603D|nr:uncharacterized protein LOC125546905 [Triticum urartu]
MTYEGVFYQEEHDDVVRNNEDDDLGYVDLDPNDDDARIDGLLIMGKSSGSSFLRGRRREEGGGDVDPELWGDLPPGAPQGWLRGNAGLPTPPSIEEHKWLIEPVGTENWILRGKGRKPNGLITVLLKEFWPGLFCPRPDRDPQLRVLATSWAHYEACSNAEYGTAAKAVITKFWQLYRVLDEHKARADVVLLAAAKKKARQLQYEVRWVAVSQYYHIYLQQKMTKTQAQRQRLTLNREQFMMVTITNLSLFQAVNYMFRAHMSCFQNLHRLFLVGAMEGMTDGRVWWIGGSATMQSLLPRASRPGLTVEKTGHTAKETGTTGASRP